MYLLVCTGGFKMDSMLFLMLLACSVTGAPPSLFPLEPPSNLLEMYPPERGQYTTKI